jgi:uncharacterized membrane protein YbhN (UPF0104 family)
VSIAVSRESKPWKRRVLLAVKCVIAALVMWGLVRAFGNARSEFAQQDFRIRQIHPGWGLAACTFYAAGMLPMCWFWHQILWAMGQRPRVGDSLRAFFIGHLGKYVPGKAMVVVLRTGWIRGPRVDTTIAALSVFVETLTMMAVGAFMAGAIIAMYFADQLVLHVLAWILTIATGIPTLPPIFRRLVVWLKVSKANPDVTAALEGLTWRLMLRGWMANLLGWFLFGLSLWATLRAVPMGPPVSEWWALAPRLTASVCLAMVAGFVSLLPGGVGVRELVLNALMVPVFGPVKALLGAVVLRMVWLVTELLLSIILYASGRAGLGR